MTTPQHKITAPANHLWPLLTCGGARVVSVSSGGHHRSPIRWEDLLFAVDPERARRPWALSAELTGVDAFAATA